MCALSRALSAAFCSVVLCPWGGAQRSLCFAPLYRGWSSGVLARPRATRGSWHVLWRTSYVFVCVYVGGPPALLLIVLIIVVIHVLARRDLFWDSPTGSYALRAHQRVNSVTRYQYLLREVGLLLTNVTFSRFRGSFPRLRNLFFFLSSGRTGRSVYKDLKGHTSVPSGYAVNGHITVHLWFRRGVVPATQISALGRGVHVQRVVFGLQTRIILNWSFVVGASVFRVPFTPLCLQYLLRVYQLLLQCYGAWDLP